MPGIPSIDSLLLFCRSVLLPGGGLVPVPDLPSRKGGLAPPDPGLGLSGTGGLIPILSPLPGLGLLGRLGGLLLVKLGWTRLKTGAGSETR